MKNLTVRILFLSCCVILLSAIPGLAQYQSPYPYPSSQYPYPSNQYPYPSSQYPYPSNQFPYPSNQYPYPSNQFPNLPIPPMAYQPQPYQPYIPSQPYIQPCDPSSCFSPPVQQPMHCWSIGNWYGPQQMYRCGLSLVYAKRYHEAIQVFQNFLQSYPQSSLADNALYWTGECYYAQKQYHIALSYFQRVLFEYPRGNKVPDATLKIALSHMSLKQYSEGCRVLRELIACYPNSEPARKAYRWLGRCGGGYYDPYPGNYGQYDSPYYGESVLPHYGEPQLPPYSDSRLPKNW